MQGESIYLKVHEIDMDGNCMYRALAESRFVSDHIAKFKSDTSMERYKYVREVLYKFAKANHKLSFIIWKHYVPEKKEDTRSPLQRYDSWVESLNENKIWGGQAEYTLFAYAFNVHVVCVRQLQYEVEPICTIEFHNKLKDEKDRKKYIELEKKPLTPYDVVFIWHHRTKVPRDKLGAGCLGNHYSFLSYNEKKKQRMYHDVFVMQHSIPGTNFFYMYSPDGSKRNNEDENSQDRTPPNDKKIVSNTPASKKTPTRTTKMKQVTPKGTPQSDHKLKEPNIGLRNSPKRTPPKARLMKQVRPKPAPQSHKTTPAKRKEMPKTTVATRLEERRMKQMRKESLEKIPIETQTELKENETVKIDMNPPHVNVEDFDDEIIEYDLPAIVGVPVSSLMREEMEIAMADKYLFFETKDNDGKGNCFYNSILNSNAFSPAATTIDDDHDFDPLLAMREDLRLFAVKNEQLSDLIFDREVDYDERKEWAGKLLVDVTKFHQDEKFVWIIEKLKRDEIFNEAEGKTTSGKSNARDPRVVMKTLEKKCQRDQKYTRSLIEKHFDNDEIKKMAKQWWLKSIGTDLEWAGLPEMLLFSLKFHKHLVILSSRVNGPQVNGSYSTINSMRSDINGLVQIPEKSKHRETIFLWAVDPHDPTTPLEWSAQTQHYVTLNMIPKISKTKKSKAFYFKAFVDNEKKVKQKKAKDKGKKTNDTIG
jgi:hypothetical protein